MDLKQPDIHMHKNDLDADRPPFAEINSELRNPEKTAPQKPRPPVSGRDVLDVMQKARALGQDG